MKTGINPAITILSLQETALAKMLNTVTMNKMLTAENIDGNKAYTITDLLTDLKQTVFSELITKKPIDAFRRNLQKAYIERLGAIINPPAAAGITNLIFGNTTLQLDVKKSDILSYLKENAKELKTLSDAAARGNIDKASKYHLQDISDRLRKILDPKS